MAMSYGETPLEFPLPGVERQLNCPAGAHESGILSGLQPPFLPHLGNGFGLLSSFGQPKLSHARSTVFRIRIPEKRQTLRTQILNKKGLSDESHGRS